VSEWTQTGKSNEWSMDEEARMATSAARDLSERAASHAKRVPSDSFDRAVRRALLLLAGAVVVLIAGIVVLVTLLW